MFVLLFAGLTFPAACGSDGKPFAFPTVSSVEVGVDPTVVSNTSPPKETQFQVLTEGTGHPVGPDDVLVAHAKGQVWSDGGVAVPTFVNTFTGKHMLFQPISQTVPGWGKVLPGIKVGSRVLIVNPPADGFGDQGQPDIGVTKDDSIIWIIDVVESAPVDSLAPGTPAKAPASAASLPTVTDGKSPTITVPKVDPPKKLVVQSLLNGTGVKVKAGEMVLAQYTGAIWSSGEVFDTTWAPQRGPYGFRVAETDQQTGEPGVIKGWVQGLTGIRVGSRILLIVPPKLGYGKQGKAPIGGTDTMVFVIDVLGVFPDPTK